MRARIVVTATILTLLSCSSPSKLTRVEKIAHIDRPSNLSPSEDCVALWENIERFGTEMDDASPEWNKVVIQSSYELIEKGCVRRARE
jgi:hypothetical protein